MFTGVAMGYGLSDFLQRSGHRPAVWEQFVSFGHQKPGRFGQIFRKQLAFRILSQKS